VAVMDVDDFNCELTGNEYWPELKEAIEEAEDVAIAIFRLRKERTGVSVDELRRELGFPPRKTGGGGRA
jgi:hypothetical protein